MQVKPTIERCICGALLLLNEEDGELELRMNVRKQFRPFHFPIQFKFISLILERANFIEGIRAQNKISQFLAAHIGLKSGLDENGDSSILFHEFNIAFKEVFVV